MTKYFQTIKIILRKNKKLLKEKNKLKEKIALKMELPNDTMDFNLQGDNEIFSLSKIKTKKVRHFKY